MLVYLLNTEGTIVRTVEMFIHIRLQKVKVVYHQHLVVESGEDSTFIQAAVMASARRCRNKIYASTLPSLKYSAVNSHQ